MVSPYGPSQVSGITSVIRGLAREYSTRGHSTCLAAPSTEANPEVEMLTVPTLRPFANLRLAIGTIRFVLERKEALGCGSCPSAACPDLLWRPFWGELWGDQSSPPAYVCDEPRRARARPNGFCSCLLHPPEREEASFRWRSAASCSSTRMRLRS